VVGVQSTFDTLLEGFCKIGSRLGISSKLEGIFIKFLKNWREQNAIYKFEGVSIKSPKYGLNYILILTKCRGIF
jgi:hypothetical protein